MPDRPLESASSTGSTKQADSWPRGRPAFIRVGELGIHTRGAIGPIRSRDGPGHSPEQVLRTLHGLPVVVLHEIPALEDGERVGVQVETMAGFRCGHANLMVERGEFRKLMERGGPR